MGECFEAGGLRYQEEFIRVRTADGLVCLTDLWKADGRPEGLEPTSWADRDSTRALLRQLARSRGSGRDQFDGGAGTPHDRGMDSGIPGILETTPEGGASETFAMSALAIVYARSLSVRCYEWAVESLSVRIGTEQGLNPGRAPTAEPVREGLPRTTAVMSEGSPSLVLAAASAGEGRRNAADPDGLAFHHDTGAFHHDTGAFHHDTGAFHHDTGDFPEDAPPRGRSDRATS